MFYNKVVQIFKKLLVLSFIASPSFLQHSILKTLVGSKLIKSLKVAENSRHCQGGGTGGGKKSLLIRT